MTSVFVFILVSYAVTFLIADASIFGCGTAAYNEDPEDVEYIWSKGVFKIRPYFLTSSFFNSLFSCYFCLGVWTGPLAHALLYHSVGDRYWFYHSNTTSSWALGSVVASLVSATSCYALNALLDRLQGVSPEPPDLDILETYSGHSQDDS